ncbi:type II secretion system protein [Candidatus Curtissbacteria bacterium]|nr:type II secretion system protein [Candidatus Curtissbacteria bacterium]
MFFKKGFTLIELILVVTILGLVVVFSSVVFTNQQNQTSLESTILEVNSAIRESQNKSVSQSQDASGDDNYGIYFTSTSYTVFKGINYSSNNSTNFVVNFSSGITLSQINLPNSQLIFDRLTGKLTAYSDVQNTLVFSSFDNVTKTVTINPYGAITIQ